MVKKETEAVEARLQQLIKARAPEFSWRRDHPVIGISGKPPDLDDPDVWIGRARAALVVGQQEADLRKAFDTFNLDPRDPRDWADLLRLFTQVIAPVLSAEPKKRGAPRKWTRERREELLELVDRVKKSHPRTIADELACEMLIKAADTPAYIRDTEATGLIKQIELGRRGRYNRSLGLVDSEDPSTAT